MPEERLERSLALACSESGVSASSTILGFSAPILSVPCWGIRSTFLVLGPNWGPSTASVSMCQQRGVVGWPAGVFSVRRECFLLVQRQVRGREGDRGSRGVGCPGGLGTALGEAGRRGRRAMHELN